MGKQFQERKTVLNVTKFLVFAAITTSVITLSLVGCQEANQAGSQKTRQIAAENIELKKQLDECNNKLEQEKARLEDCIQQKEKIQKASSEEDRELLTALIERFEKESQQLTEENEKLKAEIQELKKQLEEAK
jgi:predicted nuclease with TOPRIM domain